MSKFRSTNDNHNCFLVEAQSLMSIRGQLRLPALGIVAIGNDGVIVGQQDFAANGITADSLYRFEIRTSYGNGGDDSASVPDFGAYVNVAMELHSLRTAADPAAAISRMIAVERPGVSIAEVEGTINSLPGVNRARDAALKKWVKSSIEAPPPVPPGP